jgi:predicted nicotinamide N-methyase
MPVRPPRRRAPQERHAFGLTILSPSHPDVQRLQHDAAPPSLHGHKVWPMSFVLLDYLHQRGVAPQARVLDLGCGWGLVGIACAKTFQAQVTGLDADAAVFPYLQLHAQRNGVHLAMRHGTFADLAPQDLRAFDLILGADICFWEELVDPLYQLVRQGVAAGVAEILIADPSRPPFDELCARCVAQGDAEVFTWTITTPVADTGRILRVVGQGAAAGARWSSRRRGAGLHPVLKGFPRRKGRDRFRRNLDGLARAGVASGPRLAVAHVESAKTS